MSRPIRIAKHTLTQYSGMTMRDIWRIFNETPRGKGTGYLRICRAIKHYGIRHLFPKMGGEAAWRARKGYCNG